MADSTSEELNVVGVEFGAMVKLYWVNYKTGETGYTEMTYDAYQRNLKPVPNNYGTQVQPLRDND